MACTQKMNNTVDIYNIIADNCQKFPKPSIAEIFDGIIFLLCGKGCHIICRHINMAKYSQDKKNFINEDEGTGGKIFPPGKNFWLYSVCAKYPMKVRAPLTYKLVQLLTHNFIKINILSVLTF